MNGWLRKKIDEPLFKTLAGVVSTIIAAILAGAFVTEITQNGVLKWSLFYKTKSFYGLVILSLVMYFYYKFLYEAENAVSNFKDDDYIKAYMLKECLPELAEKSRELIRAGKSTKEIKNIIKDLNLKI